MGDQRPGINGRLALTLRVGDAARIDVPHPVGRSIVIACDTAGGDDASFLISAWAGLQIRSSKVQSDRFAGPDRFVRMRLHEKIELAPQANRGDGLEVYVSLIEPDRATVSLDAPKDWKITRLPRAA